MNVDMDVIMAVVVDVTVGAFIDNGVDCGSVAYIVGADVVDGGEMGAVVGLEVTALSLVKTRILSIYILILLDSVELVVI